MLERLILKRMNEALAKSAFEAGEELVLNFKRNLKRERFFKTGRSYSSIKPLRWGAKFRNEILWNHSERNALVRVKDHYRMGKLIRSHQRRKRKRPLLNVGKEVPLKFLKIFDSHLVFDFEISLA